MAQTKGAREPQGPALARTLVIGFFELAKRELRTPDLLLPPTPNAVSTIIDEELAAGRMRYDPHTHDLSVIDEKTRTTINARLLPVLQGLEHIPVSRALAQHLRSTDSEFARVVANSPTVFDSRNGSLVFLSHDDALTTNTRLERARRATTITDPNLRYCLGELTAAGGVFERNEHGSLTCIMARQDQVGNALAMLYEASRPSPERLNRLQSLLYSPDVSEKLGLGRDPTAQQLDEFAARLTRWDIERLEQQVGSALYATYRDGLTIAPNGRAQPGRSADQYFSQPHERARSERPFEIGPNPEDAAGRARRLAREREAGNGQAGLHALHEDRAKLEQLIERQQSTPSEPIVSERALTRERPDRAESGLIIAGSLIKLTRFHGLVHADDGSYYIFEIDALARSKIGERANWRDGAPVRPALLAIANKDARVWLRRSHDGALSFEAERPQTIEARRERAAQERNETSVEYEARQRLQLDLALCMRHATELYAHAHELAPESIATMDLADRAETMAYRGTIGWVGSCYFVQVCKAGNHCIAVPHELAAFERTPEIGATWSITYPEGEEFARGQCSIARTRDTKLRELARDAVPALDGEQVLRQEQRLYALAAMTTGAQHGIPREELPLIDLQALTESRYLVGAVVQASPDMSFAHIEGGGLLCLDHGRLARTFDVGDTVGVHWDSKHYQVTLAQHEHIDLSLERERDQRLANYEEQREQLISDALTYIATQTLADECGLHPDNCTIRTVSRGETLDPKTSPGAIHLEKIQASLALATSAQTFFVGTGLDRSTVVWQLATNDERGFERAGMSEARRLGGARLWHSDDGDLVISPSKPEGPHQENVKLHTFRPIEPRRDEHGAYTGDTFKGTIAAVGDVGLVVDTGHFDYMFIDREELDARDLRDISVGQTVEMEFRAGLVKLDRVAERSQAIETNRERGGLSR